MTAFADTNLIAYALDDFEPAKQPIARSVLRTSPRPRTSPQVLRQVCVVAGSKLGLSRDEALAAIRALDFDGVVVENPFAGPA